MAEAAPGSAARPCRPAFDPKRRQVFVVGNEAADADSLVTAYAMAALMESPDVQAIALAQIPREEFRLRGDALSLFQRAGCEVAADGSPVGMQFWDEVDWDAVRSLDTRSLVLTDHNKMTPMVADVFSGRVEWVLDHHADSRSYPEARVDLDESLGSACTLVAEQYLAKSETLPANIGVLLAGVILLDTRNFDPKEAKGTPRDRAALDRLASHVPDAGAAAWYEELMNARKDVSHLSVRELLMLDLKAASVAGFSGLVAFSSIMGTLDGVCAQAGGPEALLATLRGFAAERGYEAIVGLFSPDEKGFRGLAAAPTTEAQQPLCAAVEARLAGAPGNLQKELRENPLYAAQGILEEGFGLTPRSDLLPLRAFSLRAVISRKTLLPRATSQEDGAAAL